MKPELKDKKNSDKKFVGKRKQRLGIKAFYDTCMYSLAGIFNYFFHEASSKRVIFSIIMELILVLTLKASYVQILAFIILLATITAVEMLNTGIEEICDLVCPEYNKAIKIAKDSGSGATFVLSSTLFILNCIIFIPKIIALF